MDKKSKILIVDDDPMNLDILEEILEDEYIIEKAQTGEETLEKLPIFMPDLILLDIMMPGITGYETCKRIRQNEKFSFIKIILVSGKAMVNERLQGYESGADDYITKPFIDEELEAKVRIFLRLKHTEEVEKIKDELLQMFNSETMTPLHAIISLAEFHRDDRQWTQELEEDLGQIADKAYEIHDLIRKTTLICDLKAGKEIEITGQSATQRISDIISRHNMEAKEKNIDFKVDIEDDEILQTDWKLLDRAIDNVVDNAVKFSENDQTVDLKLGNQNGFYKIDIKDHGIGIKPENIRKIFDEFSVRDFMRPESKGLSLAITRHILNRLGGQIEVVSSPGEGSTFTIKIPRNTEIEEEIW
ncbi:MAG: response regulator [Candidatus Zixiibacteriota bacterium]